MAVTIGISVHSPERKQELFDRLSALPGETKEEKLEFCLLSAEQEAAYASKDPRLLGARDTLNHAYKEISAILQRTDNANMEALAERDQTIAELRARIAEQQETLCFQQKTITEYEEVIQSRNEKIAVLQDDIKTLSAANENYLNQLADRRLLIALLQGAQVECEKGTVNSEKRTKRSKRQTSSVETKAAIEQKVEVISGQMKMDI